MFALSTRAPLVSNARVGAHSFIRLPHIDRTHRLSQVDREWAESLLEEGARHAFNVNLIIAPEFTALVVTCSDASLTPVLTHCRRRERLELTTRAAHSLAIANASSLNQHADERPHDQSIVLETLGRTPTPHHQHYAHNLWRSSRNDCLAFSAHCNRADATSALSTACVRTRTRRSSLQPQRRHSFRSQTGTLRLHNTVDKYRKISIDTLEYTVRVFNMYSYTRTPLFKPFC